MKKTKTAVRVVKDKTVSVKDMLLALREHSESGRIKVYAVEGNLTVESEKDGLRLVAPKNGVIVIHKAL